MIFRLYLTIAIGCAYTAFSFRVKRQFNRLDYGQNENFFVNRLQPHYYDSMETSSELQLPYEYFFNRLVVPSTQRIHPSPLIQRTNQNYMLSDWNLNTRNPVVEYPNKFYKEYRPYPYISNSDVIRPIILERELFVPQSMAVKTKSRLTEDYVNIPPVLLKKNGNFIDNSRVIYSNKPDIFEDRMKYINDTSSKYMANTVAQQPTFFGKLLVNEINNEVVRAQETAIPQQGIQTTLISNSVNTNLTRENAKEKFIQMAVEEDVKSTEYTAGKLLTKKPNITQESSTAQSLLQTLEPAVSLYYTNSQIQKQENPLSSTILRSFGMRAPPLPKDVADRIHKM